MKKFILIVVPLLIFAQLLFSQNYHVNENFNSGSLPTGWTNSAVSGTQTWSFGVDGASASGNQNIDGTGFAYFDDDALGGSFTNNTVELLSPIFDNSSVAPSYLKFDYNFKQFASATDSFYVEVYDGVIWQQVFYVSVDDCGNYYYCNSFPSALIDISPYKNTNCQVRFTYHDGNDWGWYVGLDNVEIYSDYSHDLSVIRFNELQNGCNFSANDSIEIQIYNAGYLSQSNFLVAYSLNGNTPVVEMVNQTVNYLDTINYVFQTTADFSKSGTYQILSYTNLPNDSIRLNDSSLISIQVDSVFSFPYQEGFEKGPGGWTSYGDSSSWSRGLPNGAAIDSTLEGDFIFATNTNGNYNNNELSYLESPCLNFGNLTHDPSISFLINYQLQSSFDQAWLEISTDYGFSWSKFIPGSSAINWYSISKSFWFGNSNGWKLAESRLTGLAGATNVKIRFVFDSDGNTVKEGVGIDDIRINQHYQNDIFLAKVNSPIDLTNLPCGSFNDSITITVKNKGINDITSFLASYQIDGGLVITDTVNQLITSDSVIQYTFLQPFSFIAAKKYEIIAWLDLIGDSTHLNDSIYYSFNNKDFAAKVDPYIENFESFTSGSGATNTGSMLAEGWTSNGSIWGARNSPTNSIATGPSYDHTLGKEKNGTFIYIENSLSTVGAIAEFTSPCINIENTQYAVMGFWYHKYGSNIPDLFIDVYDGSQWITGPNNMGFVRVFGETQFSSHDAWLYKTVDLNQFSGSRIKVRFRSSSLTGYYGDVAIDDLKIFDASKHDVELAELKNEQCFVDTSFSLKTVLLNNSLNTVPPNTISVSYQAEGQSIITETIGDSILFSQLYTHTFSSSNKIPIKDSIAVKVWISYPYDTVAYNDTLIQTFYSNIKLENFESDGFVGYNSTTTSTVNGWVNNSKLGLRNWIIFQTGGTGLGPLRDHTYGSNAFGKYIINSSNISLNIDTTSLTSVCINLTNSLNPQISYWYHMYGNGVGQLKLEAFDGTNWIALDSIIGPQQLSLTSPWLNRTIDINLPSLLTQEFEIRFVGISQGSNSYIALDDIEFLGDRGKDIALGIYENLNPVTCVNAKMPLSIQVYNDGRDPLDFSQDSVFINTTFLSQSVLNLSDTLVNNNINNGLPLLHGDTINVFLDSIDIGAIGTYVLTTFISLENDVNSSNDVIGFNFQTTQCHVGLEENNTLDAIKIYPNPTNGLLNIHFGNASVTSIEVLNQLGQRIEELQTNGKSKIQLEIKGRKGIYFIRLIGENGVKVQKVIKN